MRVSRDCAAFQEWKQEISEFGQRLDKLIKDSGKTQRDVAKDLGITEAQISTWKMGKATQISAFNVWRLTRYFNVSADWLLTGRYAVSKRRPLPPAPKYTTLGGEKK
jgi:transcriptional regulator with XRE-family HTH domain